MIVILQAYIGRIFIINPVIAGVNERFAPVAAKRAGQLPGAGPDRFGDGDIQRRKFRYFD